jgi:hypothetical protein
MAEINEGVEEQVSKMAGRHNVFTVLLSSDGIQIH